MATQWCDNMFVYSQDFTCQSKLATSCLAELNELCERDYGKSYFPVSIVCLDLDAYETSCTGNNDATMDAAAGMADWQRNHSSNNRHLLIELRFGYRSTSNFDLGNMKQKVSHSRDILNPERINEQVVFIYEPNVAAQASNYFSRLSRQDSEVRTWKAMDVEGFGNYIVDSATLPYEAENDLDKLVKELSQKFDEGGLSALDSLLKYWIEQMDKYNLRYKHAESDAVARSMLTYLQTISFQKGTFEGEYLAMRIEEITRFVQSE